MLLKAQKYAALSPGERSIVLRATLLLPLIEAMLRAKGFNWTRSHVQSKVSIKNGVRDPDQLLVAENVTRLVFLTANNLKIGVNKEGADLDAHAWLELDGQVLNESHDTRNGYKVLDIDFENSNIQNG